MAEMNSASVPLAPPSDRRQLAVDKPGRVTRSDGSEKGGNSSQPKNAGATAKQDVQSSGKCYEWPISSPLLPCHAVHCHSGRCGIFEDDLNVCFGFSGSDGSEMGGNSSQPKNAGATAKQGVQSSGTSEHVEAQPLKPSRSSAVEESPVRHRRRPRRRRRRPTLPEYIKSHILIFAGADTSEMGGDSNQPQSASASSEQRIQSSNFSPDQLIDDLLVGPCKLLSARKSTDLSSGSSADLRWIESDGSPCTRPWTTGAKNVHHVALILMSSFLCGCLHLRVEPQTWGHQVPLLAQVPPVARFAKSRPGPNPAQRPRQLDVAALPVLRGTVLSEQHL
ncbi:uncharacterized protein LOC132388288 [Hypanus sabinus]|uniref:uncharacterized protein LOC132388288 n=1 Tax=Hypanus sabinus TaxID=79690 RepID=UPI0028C4BD3E|nr:uncharacterized protein LOC132388288 [Hypanus sabinus]